MLMPARKQGDTDTSVVTKPPSALAGKEVRSLETVAAEIRRLRDEEGLSTQEIHEMLQVSFDVINQLFLQSYKMTMNTGETFEVQEKMRLGLI